MDANSQPEAKAVEASGADAGPVACETASRPARGRMRDGGGGDAAAATFEADVDAGKREGLPSGQAKVYASDLAEMRQLTREMSEKNKEQDLLLDRARRLLTRMAIQTAGRSPGERHNIATELEILRAAVERGDKPIALSQTEILADLLGVAPAQEIFPPGPELAPGGGPRDALTSRPRRGSGSRREGGTA